MVSGIAESAGMSANMLQAECIYKKKWQPPTPSATKASRPSSQATYTNGVVPTRTTLSADDDAKLIFGTVFSLRNMVRKLGGDDDRLVATVRFITILIRLPVSYRTEPPNTSYTTSKHPPTSSLSCSQTSSLVQCE